jgi:hypothetical protein
MAFAAGAIAQLAKHRLGKLHASPNKARYIHATAISLLPTIAVDGELLKERAVPKPAYYSTKY